MDLKTQQIQYIIDRLENVYEHERKILFYIRNANKLLNNGHEDVALISLDNILLNPNLSSDMKTIHENIINDAKIYGQTIRSINQECIFFQISIFNFRFRIFKYSNFK